MRHIRMFESQAAFHWRVPGPEMDPAKYEVASEGEGDRITGMLRRAGMLGAQESFGEREDYHRYLECDLCESTGAVECGSCGGDGCDDCESGQAECPRGRAFAERYFRELHLFLCVSLDKIQDDYWQLTMHLINEDNEVTNNLHIKCDGLRGLEVAIDAVVGPRVRMLGEASDLVKKSLDLEDGVQVNG